MVDVAPKDVLAYQLSRAGEHELEEWVARQIVLGHVHLIQAFLQLAKAMVFRGKFQHQKRMILPSDN